jgi:hypothetical protein
VIITQRKKAAFRGLHRRRYAPPNREDVLFKFLTGLFLGMSLSISLADQLANTRDQSDEAVIRIFNAKSEDCQGGNGDDVNTWIACTYKEQARTALVIRGYCQSDDGWKKGKPINDDGECQ